jgi:hypothetical protein
MDSPSVCVIVLNWNNWQDTLECLDSLVRVNYPLFQIIVVDNGSEDDSFDRIRRFCMGIGAVRGYMEVQKSESKPITLIDSPDEHLRECKPKVHEGASPTNGDSEKIVLIRSNTNLGYSGGNNLGIDFALRLFKPDYVLLLNNDTVVDSRFLGELVSASESNSRIGFAGPKILYYSFHGRKDVINFAGGKINLWIGGAKHILANQPDNKTGESVTEVDYVEGSCLLARVEMLNKIGLLDPSFFLFWEETDWCVRGRKAGYKCVCVQASRIWHKVGATVTSRDSFFYNTRNMFWFMRRYATNLQLISFSLYLAMFAFWFNAAVTLGVHKRKDEFMAYCRGIRDGVLRPKS